MKIKYAGDYSFICERVDRKAPSFIYPVLDLNLLQKVAYIFLKEEKVFIKES